MTARRASAAGARGATERGVSERGAVVRSIGVAPGRAPDARPAERFVAVDRLREHLDRVEWAPLRLSGDRRARPASPRLPHALVLHLAHAARSASGAADALDAVAVRPDLDALASFLGVDREAVAGALAALERAGLVHAGGGADTLAANTLAANTLALAPTLLGSPPRAAALDWADVAVATAGSPSAWLAAHVLAERLVPGEWTPVPRSALEQALACGTSGVRGALDRLAAAGVVERREQRGGVSAYRFAARPAPAPPVRAPPEAPAGLIARAPEPVVGAPLVGARAGEARAPSPSPATGVRLTVGGVQLDVPAGLCVRVELGPDGRPQIALVPADAPPS